jgi:hypothetical protein
MTDVTINSIDKFGPKRLFTLPPEVLDYSNKQSYQVVEYRGIRFDIFWKSNLSDITISGSAISLFSPQFAEDIPVRGYDRYPVAIFFAPFTLQLENPPAETWNTYNFAMAFDIGTKTPKNLDTPDWVPLSSLSCDLYFDCDDIAQLDPAIINWSISGHTDWSRRTTKLVVDRDIPATTKKQLYCVTGPYVAGPASPVAAGSALWSLSGEFAVIMARSPQDRDKLQKLLADSTW